MSRRTVKAISNLAARKAALLQDFKDWTGGYEPAECEPNTVDQYITVSLMGGVTEAEATKWLGEAQRTPADALSPIQKAQKAALQGNRERTFSSIQRNLVRLTVLYCVPTHEAEEIAYMDRVDHQIRFLTQLCEAWKETQQKIADLK